MRSQFSQIQLPWVERSVPLRVDIRGEDSSALNHQKNFRGNEITSTTIDWKQQSRAREGIVRISRDDKLKMRLNDVKIKLFRTGQKVGFVTF